MNRCVLCNKIFTKNMDDVLASDRYTFVIDDTDRYCESCDARKRGAACVNSIHADMSKDIEISRNKKIHSAEAYLSKKLDEYKVYWTNWFINFLKGQDRVKYSFWLSVFNEYVSQNATIYPKEKAVMTEEVIKNRADFE